MARAEYNDILVNSEGHPVRGVVLKPETNVKVHAGAEGEAVFWAGETGPGTVASVKSNAQGLIQLWLTEGRYDVSIPRFQVAKTIDVINQTTVAGGGGEGLPPQVVTSRDVSLGNISGNVALNLSAGDVFKATPTAPVALIAPTGYGGSNRRRIFEFDPAGEQPITFPFLTDWVFGSQPPTGPYQFYTDDGVSYYGVGVEGIPAEYARLGTIADEQFAVYDATSGKLNGATPSSGLSKAEVETIVQTLAILNGGHPMEATGTPSAGQLPVTISGGAWEYLPTAEVVLALAMDRLKTGATATSSKTMPEVTGVIYPVSKKAITLTLPVNFPSPDGGILAFENITNGAFSIAGITKPGAEGTSTEEVQPGETILLRGNTSALVWKVLARNRPAGDLTTPNINTTTSKTSKQITEAYEASFTPEKPPRATSKAVDLTNGLDLYFSGSKWFKSPAAFVEIT